MNHVIIEGPDGSGKTQLIESLGLPNEHVLAFKPEYGDPIAYYAEKLADDEPKAFDRFFLSELVYGPILRGRSAIADAQIDILRGMFPRVSVIMCLPPFATTYLATRSRPWPDYQTDEFLAKSYADFQKLADSRLVDYVYDWTTGTLRPSRRLPAALLSLGTLTHA